jgi:hypothetical protein
MGAFATALLLGLLGTGCRDEQPIKVTVVVVLGTADNTHVDPKLADLAKEIQKRDPKLTGCRRVGTEAKSIPVGESVTFALVEKQELRVKVEKGRDAEGRVRLSIKAPGLGEASYSCVCDKFFPVVSPFITKKGETLIVAVMAKPCTAKK